MLSKIRKIKPVYIVVAVVLAVPLAYVSYRQYTVKTCYSDAKSKYNKAVRDVSNKKGYDVRLDLDDEEFMIERLYIICMRDKGFSG